MVSDSTDRCAHAEMVTVSCVWKAQKTKRNTA